MNQTTKNNQYDVIIVGSGTCGATIARQLSLHNKKVLLLEQGVTSPLKESFMGIAAVAREVAVGDKLKAARAITTGGSTGIYFGVANHPPLATFKAMGIDLSSAWQEVQDEVPIAQLPDSLLTPQSLTLRQSAIDLGFDWQKNLMMIDQSKCNDGYNNDARWRARSYVDEAISHGATLVTRATVDKILIENGRAIGVEYNLKTGTFSRQTCQAYGAKVIIAAGALATPKLLRDNGIDHVGDRGFYCDPGYALFGIVPGMKGGSGFVGNSFCQYDEGIDLGDANMSQVFHRMLMLASLKFRHCFSFEQTLGIGVKVNDGLGGELKPKGGFYKTFDKDDYAKLAKGEAAAIKILKNAGAKHIFNSGLVVAGHVGGLIRIGQHVDTDLQTQFKNLYVCDGSLLDETIRVTPTVTLICLAKYLASQLLTSNSASYNQSIL